MTEAEWLACNDPAPMVRSVNRRLRARARREGRLPDLERFRLFACACCRRLWPLLMKEDQEAVQLLETYTKSLDPKDRIHARKLHRPAGQQSRNEMASVSRDRPASEPLLLIAWAKHLATCAVWESTTKKPTSSANAYLSAARAVGSMERATTNEEHLEARSGIRPPIDWYVVSEGDLAVQASLFRDIFGNPFRPAAVDPS